MPRRPFRNIILPAMILLPLMILLVGCLYIPTGEDVDTNGAKKDFRTLVAGEHKTIVPGVITRQQVELLLGRPQAESANRRMAVYFVTTGKGVWVKPICFTALWADHKLHVLELKYDEREQLTSVDSFVDDCTKKAHGIEFIDRTQEGYVSLAKRLAIHAINKKNGFHEGFFGRFDDSDKTVNTPEPPRSFHVDQDQ